MRLPRVLDRYQIQYPIGLPPSNRVFLATDLVSDAPVVLKLTTDTDVFFEALARYYTCDGLSITPDILDNVPPFRVTQSQALMDPELIHLLRLPKLPAQPEDMLTHPAADLGLLVLEHIDGLNFEAHMASLPSADARAEALTLLVKAVDLLHERGELHGRLMPGHVLWDNRRERPLLLSLGHTPHRRTELLGASPEHVRDTYFEVSTATDVYMLAHNFMREHVDCRPNLVNYVAQALDPDPRQRPPMDQMLEAFPPLTKKPAATTANPSPHTKHPRRRSPWLWALTTLFLSAAGISIVTAWPDAPDTIPVISDASVDVPTKLSRVIGLHDIAVDQPVDLVKQRALAADLSAVRHQANIPHKPLPLRDLTQPIAVMAFADQPLLVGQDNIYQLGDWVDIQGRSGYVASMVNSQIQVQFKAELANYKLAPPGFNDWRPNYAPGVVIWKEKGNLAKLLQAMKTLAANRQDLPTPLHQLSKLSIPQIQACDDTLYGAYNALTLDDFFNDLSNQIKFNHRDHGPIITRARDTLPFHYRPTFYQTENYSLTRFANYLSENIGLPVVVDDGGDKRIPQALFSSQTLEEIFSELGIRWHVSETTEKLVIHLSMR